MVLGVVAFVTRRKKPMCKLRFPLMRALQGSDPGAGHGGTGRVLGEGLRWREEARAGMGVCWAQQCLGESVLAHSLNVASVVIRSDFGAWSSENLPTSNLSICPTRV